MNDAATTRAGLDKLEKDRFILGGLNISCPETGNSFSR